MVAFPKRAFILLMLLIPAKEQRWLNKSSMKGARPYFSIGAKKIQEKRERSPYFLPDEANLHTAAKVRDGGRRKGKRNGTRTKWTSNPLCKVVLTHRNQI